MSYRSLIIQTVQKLMIVKMKLVVRLVLITQLSWIGLVMAEDSKSLGSDPNQLHITDYYSFIQEASLSK